MKTQVKTHKLTVALLTMAVAFGLFAALPQMAYAANETELATQINNFNPNNTGPATGQLTAVANTSNHTVTVTSGTTGVRASLVLDINAGVTVVWKAEYNGWASDYSLIIIGGTGTFEVAEGAVISNYGPYSTIEGASTECLIRVSGGTVSADLSGNAILTVGRVEINDGTVLSDSGSCIYVGSRTFNTGGIVTINGGTLRTIGVGATISCSVSCKDIDFTMNSGFVDNTGTGHAIDFPGEYASVCQTGGTIQSSQGTPIRMIGVGSLVNITGGFVHSVGGDPAVEAKNIFIYGGHLRCASNMGHYGTIKAIGRDSAVSVSGGMVEAGESFALYQDDIGITVVSGGFVFAYGTILEGDNSDISLLFYEYPVITGDGILCVWNKAAGNTVYTEGSSTDLTATDGASVYWGTNSGVVGIHYTKGSNTGFLMILGVTLQAAPTASTPPTSSSTTPDESATSSSSGAESSSNPSATNSEDDTEDDSSGSDSINGFNWLWIVLGGLVIVALGCGTAFIILRKKGKVSSDTTKYDSESKPEE